MSGLPGGYDFGCQVTVDVVAKNQLEDVTARGRGTVRLPRKGGLSRGRTDAPIRALEASTRGLDLGRLRRRRRDRPLNLITSAKVREAAAEVREA
jgi:hypothetical protein